MRAFKISLIVLGVLFFIATIGWLEAKRDKRDFLAETTTVVLEDLKKQSFKEEKILTKWVFEKSTKISMQTAETIVKEAMKVEKPLLMLALIEVESSFVPTSLSNKGAFGLTQVMPKVHGKMLKEAKIIKDDRDLFDIQPSIQAGNLILNGYLKDSKGDISKALERYLGGKDGAYLHKILVNLASLYIL